MKGSHLQSLVYSMVAHGEVVLAHYSAFPTASASFRALAAACLPNLRASASASASTSTSTSSSSPSTDGIQSYTREAHTFHFLIHNNLTYLVVSDGLERDEIASTFLHRIQEDFCKRYGDADTTNIEVFKSHCLDKDFGPRLKEHMQYCLDHYEELMRRSSIKDEVVRVQEVVAHNIEKVLGSRHNIELQIDNDEILRAHVENFHRQGKQLKKEVWRRQVKLRLLVILVAAIIILSIWLIVCKGFECE